MNNLFTRALDAHKFLESSLAQQREFERRESLKKHEALRTEARQMAAKFAETVLGDGPVANIIKVTFDGATVAECNFSWEGLDWAVQFASDVFELDAYDKVEVLNRKRVGLNLFFHAPDGWFCVTSLPVLGERLARPDCAALLISTPDEAKDD